MVPPSLPVVSLRSARSASLASLSLACRERSAQVEVLPLLRPRRLLPAVPPPPRILPFPARPVVQRCFWPLVPPGRLPIPHCRIVRGCRPVPGPRWPFLAELFGKRCQLQCFTLEVSIGTPPVTDVNESSHGSDRELPPNAVDDTSIPPSNNA